MRVKPKTLVLLGLLCGLPFLLSGCILYSLFGYVGGPFTAQSIPAADNASTIVLGADITSLDECERSAGSEPAESSIRCTYGFEDGASASTANQPAQRTIFGVSSESSIYGDNSMLAFLIDPLVLQVPTDASGFSGEFNEGFGPQALAVTETTAFLAAPEQQVEAEAGHKFVIIEFPAAVVQKIQSTGSLGSFTIDFRFTVPNPDGVAVKPMYTIKMTQAGLDYFLPMLPCTTDFAQVPSIGVAKPGAGSDLMPQILAALQADATLPCDGTIYNFGTPLPLDNVAYLPLLRTQP